MLTFIDNNVDSTTGTIKLKGTFPNANRKLWPGEYANVTLKMSTQRNALVIPNQAMQTGQDGNYVYLVDDDRIAEVRPITVGLRRETELVVDKGLSEGDTVVTQGQLRLAPGSRVMSAGRKRRPPRRQERRLTSPVHSITTSRSNTTSSVVP